MLLIKYFRLSYRLCAILLITFFLCFLYLLLRIPLSQKLRWRWRAFIVSSWAKCLLKIIGAKLHIQGVLRPSPLVLVSNHLSYIDILVYAALLHPVFVAKSDIGSWPLIGFLVRIFDVALINRHSARQSYKLQEKLYQAYRQQQNVVFFPEGTSTSGETIKPFKPLLFKWLVHYQVPVHYALLSYQAPAGYDAREDICWWRPESTFHEHVAKLLTMPGFTIYVHFAEQGLIDTESKVLSQKAHQALINMHQSFHIAS